MNPSLAHEWTARLAQLCSNERNATVEFLLALAQFDRQKLWAELGFNGLFNFLQRELSLSDGAAYTRMKGAELLRRFPAIAEPLRDGRLCLTTLVEVAKVITEENWEDVLPRFYGCSKREAQVVRVTIAPEQAPPMKDVVRPLTPLRLGEVETPTASLRLGEIEAPAAAPAPAYLVRPAEVKPLTPELFRVGFTASKRFEKKLQEAKEVLAHQFPDGDLEEIFEAGLDLLLERAAKRRGLVEKPRTSAAQVTADSKAARTRQPRSAVKRELLKRDGATCQWPLASGGICGSKKFLQFDHKVPFALGGPTTLESMRILCASHNQRAAEEVFGEEFLASRRASSAEDGADTGLQKSG